MSAGSFPVDVGSGPGDFAPVGVPFRGSAPTPYDRPGVAPFGELVAAAYDGPAPVPYGGPSVQAVAGPYGGRTATPYGWPQARRPGECSAQQSALSRPPPPALKNPNGSYGTGGGGHGVGASMSTVALGQVAVGLPAEAGLTHADFSVGEPVGPVPNMTSPSFNCHHTLCHNPPDIS